MRIRLTHLILPVYALAAVLYTWPMARTFTRAVPASAELVDAPLQAFLMGWDGQALAHAPGHVFDPPIFYPERNTLTYMDHLIGETVVASPLLAISSSVAPGYNFLVLLSFVLSAWAAYRLARLFAVSRAAAFLAGFLYAFSFYRFVNLDSLNQLQTQFFPLALFFGIRFLRDARTRDFLGMTATFLAQIYFGWYYTFYLALALVILLAYGFARHRATLTRASWPACAAIALAAVALALPVSLPYWHERRLLPEFHRSLTEAEMYSASGLDYLRINSRALLARWMPSAVGGQSYWPGLVTVLLAGAALLDWLRRARGRDWGDVGYLVSLIAVAFVLSLGPFLHFAHHRAFPLPYASLFPVLSFMRAPCRLAILVLLGLTIWAALGYDLLRRRLPAKSAWLVVAIAFPLAAVSAWQLPVRTLELPRADRLPPVYAWLARQPGTPPVLELPPTQELADESESEILRQYYVLYHGKPRLDGASGFVSLRYRRFRAVMHTFPADEAIQAAANMGARLVIVHFGEYQDADRDALFHQMQADRRFEPLAQFGLDRVYRLDMGGSGG